MTVGIGIGLAVIVFGFFLWRIKAPSLDRLVDGVMRSREPAGLLEAIAKRRESVQPAAYNHAIRSLWDRFERELALELIRELARNFGTARITQYWLKQLKQVEPKLARDRLGQEFYDTYYIPELAAQCGPVG